MRPARPYSGLDRKKETLTLKADTVIWTTGQEPYDVAKIQPCGYARFPNVITGIEFERLADPRGPTGGKLLRPPDGKVIRAKKLEEIAVKVVK